MPDLKKLIPLSDAEVEEYWGIVRKVVKYYHMTKRLPAHLDEDDLCQELYGALLEALRTYSPSEGTKKTTWVRKICYFRLLDFLRADSWIPRPTFYKLVNNEEKIPSQYCVSDIVYSEDRQDDLTAMKESSIFVVLDTDNVIDVEDLANYLFNMKKRGVADRDKEILYQYFMLDKSMKSIGEMHDLTESRISQIINSYLPEIKEMAQRVIEQTHD